MFGVGTSDKTRIEEEAREAKGWRGDGVGPTVASCHGSTKLGRKEMMFQRLKGKISVWL